MRLLSHSEITNSPLRPLTAPWCVIEWNYQWTCCTSKWPDSNFYTPLMIVATSQVLLRKRCYISSFIIIIFVMGSHQVLLYFLIWMGIENGFPSDLRWLHWVWFDDIGQQLFCCSRHFESAFERHASKVFTVRASPLQCLHSSLMSLATNKSTAAFTCNKKKTFRNKYLTEVLVQ